MTVVWGMATRLRSAPPVCSRSPRRVSGGPPSLPSELRARHPETEEEYQALYQDRIVLAQSQQIFPMKEDLADWINKTLGIEYLTGENFLDMLDNGVLVCQLARVIQERAQQGVNAGTSPGPVPTIARRLWSTASRGSFFARDNMDNFIQFCHRLGVHQNLLFESDDLVLQNRPRSAVLCLLEVARIAAARYGMEPPGLVLLEKEIAEEEQSANNCLSDSGLSHSSFMSWQFQPSPTITPRHDRMRHSNSSSALGSTNRYGGRAPVARPRSGDRRSLMVTDAEHQQHNGGDKEQELRRAASEGNNAAASGGTSDGATSDTTLEDDWSRASSEEQELGDQAEEQPSELDRRVQQATRSAQRQCQCPTGQCRKLKVRKVGEGKYNIAGRNVFIRLLKGRHMMVRVGGGWDTLEHFLLRHDPCQVKVVSRDKSASPYLHIQAKYRSPPPADHVGR